MRQPARNDPAHGSPLADPAPAARLVRFIKAHEHGRAVRLPGGLAITVSRCGAATRIELAATGAAAAAIVEEMRRGEG